MGQRGEKFISHEKSLVVLAYKPGQQPHAVSRCRGQIVARFSEKERENKRIGKLRFGVRENKNQEQST